MTDQPLGDGAALPLGAQVPAWRVHHRPMDLRACRKKCRNARAGDRPHTLSPKLGTASQPTPEVGSATDHSLIANA